MAHDRADRSALRAAVSSAGTGLVVLVLSAATPASAAAQTSAALAAHMGHSAATPGVAMVGVAGEVGQGPLAMRAGVAMDAAGTFLAPMLSSGGSTSGLWTADADVGLNLGRVPLIERIVGRSNPTAFIGAGVAGVSAAAQPEAEDAAGVVPTWSWGGRAGLPLVSWLSIEAEARHRAPMDDITPVESPLREGWEYRVGLALRFGGASRAASPRTSTPRSPAPSRGGRTSDRGTRTVGTGDTRRAATAAEIADNAIDMGEDYIGTPYVWGGESPSGFDCSGFVQYVYSRQGITLPRVSRDQARAGTSINTTSLSGAARGDLLFFAGNGRTVSHVAIYAGDGRILHSSSSGRGVRYDDLYGSRGRWYLDHLVAVRRVIQDGFVWEDLVAEVDGRDDADMPARSMPLDEAFETLVGEAGDAEAPDR